MSLEWAWAEEAQSHLPVEKWMTIHSPQRLVMSARSTVTPNGAGNGEAQMKQMSPTSRWVQVVSADVSGCRKAFQIPVVSSKDALK